jgi:hypothetical protein
VVLWKPRLWYNLWFQRSLWLLDGEWTLRRKEWKQDTI